jgi:hypothetical protein
MAKAPVEAAESANDELATVQAAVRDVARPMARSLWLELFQDELSPLNDEERKAKWAEEGHKYVRICTKIVRRLERQGYEITRKDTAATEA